MCYTVSPAPFAFEDVANVIPFFFRIDDGSAIQSVLADLTGQSTVPNIFIAKQHIGGNSDLQAKKGSLQNLLKEAGAI